MPFPRRRWPSLQPRLLSSKPIDPEPLKGVSPQEGLDSGEPDPYADLDDAYARAATMRAIAEDHLAQQYGPMILAGVDLAGAARLTAARAYAMNAQIAAVLAGYEHRWTAATFTKGRGVQSRRKDAADVEAAARTAAADATSEAARVESEIIAANALLGEDRGSTITRLRLSQPSALPAFLPARLADWTVLDRWAKGPKERDQPG